MVDLSVLLVASRPRGLLALIAALLFLGCAPAGTVAKRTDLFRRERLELPGHPWGYLPYLVLTPENLHERERWPLLVFLHGSGERGRDLDLVMKEGLPWLLKDRSRFPFIVAAPQCPEKEEWSTSAVRTLLDDLASRWPIDPDRVSLTGLSAGGSAALELAAESTGQIAAVVAVSIDSGPRNPCALTGTAVWILHNQGDERIPVRTPKRIAREIEQCGADVRLTIYPSRGHDAWTYTYGRWDLYEWLLAARRRAGGIPVTSPRSSGVHPVRHHLGDPRSREESRFLEHQVPVVGRPRHVLLPLERAVT